MFSLSNITGPVKLLTSLLFGFRYLSREERENERLLKEAFSDLDSSFTSGSNRSQAAASSKGQVLRQLSKRGRILGLSKMLVKSLIFAIAGLLATLVFRFISRRKQMQLE